MLGAWAACACSINWNAEILCMLASCTVWVWSSDISNSLQVKHTETSNTNPIESTHSRKEEVVENHEVLWCSSCQKYYLLPNILHGPNIAEKKIHKARFKNEVYGGMLSLQLENSWSRMELSQTANVMETSALLFATGDALTVLEQLQYLTDWMKMQGVSSQSGQLSILYIYITVQEALYPLATHELSAIYNFLT